MKLDKDKILSRVVKETAPSGIRKFFDLAAQIKDCISLGVGEPDFNTPWEIREAAIESIKSGHTCYTSNSGLAELRELVCKYYSSRYNLDFLPQHSIITVGASEGIDLALRAISNPGDEIIVPQPCYVSYEPIVRFAGATPVKLLLQGENNFKITKQQIQDCLSEKTKAIILSYPNNPTGATMTLEELEEAIEPIRNRDIIVISDEIYSELSYDNAHASVAQIPDMKEKTIVLNGFSKAFAMTGWRLGYALAPDYIIEQMLKIHQLTIMCASTTSQDAGIAALRCSFETNFSQVRKMQKEYHRRRNFLVKTLNDMGLDCFLPKGAFYAFPSIQSTGLSSEDFCQKLLEQKKVAAVPGTAFGKSGEGYIRISYAYSMDHLIQATDRIAEFIKSL